MRHCVVITALIALGLTSMPTAAEAGRKRAKPVKRNLAVYKDTAWFRGLTEEFRLLGGPTGDLDGDGEDEAIVLYRRHGDTQGLPGGMIIFKLRGAGEKAHYSPVWHGFFEDCYARGARIEGKTLVLDFVESTLAGNKKWTRRWRLGEDFHLAGSGRSMWDRAFASASSTASSKVAGDAGGQADHILDGDLTTAWAEGHADSGTGESLSIRFSKPVDLAFVGVFTGRGVAGKMDAAAKSRWRGSNRLNKAELILDRADDSAPAEETKAMNEALGIPSGRETVDAYFSDDPAMRYFQVDQKGVTSVKLEIGTVYMGDNDDVTWVAELDLVQWVARSRVAKQK